MALRQALRALGPLLRLGGGGAQAGGGGRGWGVRSLRNMVRNAALLRMHPATALGFRV